MLSLWKHYRNMLYYHIPVALLFFFYIKSTDDPRKNLICINMININHTYKNIKTQVLPRFIIIPSSVRCVFSSSNYSFYIILYSMYYPSISCNIYRTFVQFIVKIFNKYFHKINTNVLLNELHKKYIYNNM